jgi:hypothetical protein
MPESGGLFGGRSYYPNGGNFFTRLFGQPEPPPQPAPPQHKRASQNRTEIH